MTIDYSLMMGPEDLANRAELDAQEQARAVLSQTDWAVLRQMDVGTPIPDEIRRARQAARQILNRD